MDGDFLAIDFLGDAFFDALDFRSGDSSLFSNASLYISTYSLLHFFKADIRSLSESSSSFANLLAL